MKIGLTMVGLRPDDYITVCQKADTLGYDLLMAADHLAPPLNLPSTYPYSATGEPPFTPTSPWLDPIVVLSYMAAATKRIKLATSIYILPLRHPISTARAAATLDLLSGGGFFWERGPDGCERSSKLSIKASMTGASGRTKLSRS